MHRSYYLPIQLHTYKIVNFHLWYLQRRKAWSPLPARTGRLRSVHSAETTSGARPQCLRWTKLRPERQSVPLQMNTFNYTEEKL